MHTSDTYYAKLDDRLPGHGEDLERLRRNRILMDGENLGKRSGDNRLLQIFTSTVIGPIFFEIIQRKSNQGFSDGNFQALFDLIEKDQIRRAGPDDVAIAACLPVGRRPRLRQSCREGACYYQAPAPRLNFEYVNRLSGSSGLLIGP